MPKFRVFYKDEPPADCCIIEAPDADTAKAIRGIDLVDWADMLTLEVEPIDEAAALEDDPCRAAK